MGVLGIVSSFGVGEQVTNSLVLFEQTETKLLNDVDQIVTIVESLNETQLITPELKSGIKWLNITQSETQKYKSAVINSTKEGEYGLIIFFGVVSLFCIIGSIGGFAVVKGLVLLVIIFGLILLPLTWSVVGGVTSSMVYLADGCPEIENYLESKVNNNTRVWLDYYIYCEGSSPFSGVINKTQISLTTAEIELAYVITHNVPNKQAVIEALRALIAELTTLEAKLVEINNCTIVQHSWFQLRDTVCSTILVSLAGSFFVASSIGLSLFAGIWTAIKFRAIMRTIQLRKKGYTPVVEYPYDSNSDKEAIEMPPNTTAVALLVN